MTERAGNVRKKWLGLAVITVTLTVFVAFGLARGFLGEFEARTWDWRLSTVARYSKPDPAIKIIVVDQSSLDYFAREESIFWQWPREMYEPVMRFLERAGARGVAFDVLYTEPSPYGVADDKAFAAALRGGVSAVMAAAGRRELANESSADIDLFRQRTEALAETLKGATREDISIPRYRGVTLPIPEIMESATALGNVTSEADSDGIFRHVAPVAEVGGVPMATLPLALHLATGHRIAPELQNYLDGASRLTVRFNGGAHTYQTFSIRAVIQSWIALKAGEKPILDPAEFKDSLVFVGMVAPGLLDLRPIPLARDYPGVEFNATVLDNIRHGSFIKKVNWPVGTAVAAAAILLVTGCALFIQRLRDQVAAYLVLGAIVVVGVHAAAVWGWWMPFVVPLAATALGVTAALAFQYQLEGRQHRFIKDAFRYYVSPSVIDEIVADPARLALGGVRRELTIFFSDIAGFTSISEKIEASKLSALLNRFLSEMTDIILKSGGTVDKYVGDAIVAFWNAPLEVPDHPDRAVAAAMECQTRLAALEREFVRDFGVPLRMRIGLHTGVVSVGNFGSHNRFNYTMIGDAANLASRLEGANKSFGSSILVSEATRARVGSRTVFRKVADIQVVGKSEVVTVYEPLSSPSENGSAYERGLALFEAGDRVGAAELFRTLVNDPVAQAYVARIEREKGRGEVESTWNLTEK